MLLVMKERSPKQKKKLLLLRNSVIRVLLECDKKTLLRSGHLFSAEKHSLSSVSVVAIQNFKMHSAATSLTRGNGCHS